MVFIGGFRAGRGHCRERKSMRACTSIYYAFSGKVALHASWIVSGKLLDVCRPAALPAHVSPWLVRSFEYLVAANTTIPPSLRVSRQRESTSPPHACRERPLWGIAASGDGCARNFSFQAGEESLSNRPFIAKSWTAPGSSASSYGLFVPLPPAGCSGSTCNGSSRSLASLSSSGDASYQAQEYEFFAVGGDLPLDRELPDCTPFRSEVERERIPLTLPLPSSRTDFRRY